jgi:hypothetical protein
LKTQLFLQLLNNRLLQQRLPNKGLNPMRMQRLPNKR